MLPIVFMKKGTTAAELGYNAHNNMLYVEIAEQVSAGQCWIAVLAQEIFESRYKWKNLFRRFSKSFKQELELKGHAVEIAVAARMGFDREVYFDYEARSLTQYPQFATVLFSDIKDRLKAQHANAVAWVNDHWEELKKYEAKFGKS
jgi:hypothetical protein